MSLVYLDQAANGDLIILQDDQRIVLNPEQVNTVIDILLGPKKSKTIGVDLNDLLANSKPVDPGPN